MGWLSAFAGELGLRLYRVKVSNQPTPVVQWLSALQREQSTTSAAQLTALGQELLTFKGESSRLTSDITGAARLHRAAPALMDGLAVFWDE